MEYLKTEHGVFTNNEFTGQTAEEVYEEWLNGKVAPIENITIEEQLEQLKIENAKLKGKIINLVENQEFIESCIMEMAQDVYN